ncbi:MAG TPA: tRNA-(ms[2]io[6]A)-hydroxylase [Cytophagaceae bacterium]|jgi:tRNA-(ms[2]io[6]A)-hydroxylase|nr:tRNA-(ms[2]io[6]A)-hydroxylase [Cytophagaceae bacterium]
MLGLKLPTDPRWVNIAEKSIEEILIDHAWCEQKAATSCISFVVKYPDHTKLVETLSPIVTEEWGHFRMVLRELEKRGAALGPARNDEYVIQLKKNERTGDRRERQLMDKLLINALIEARSCERFRLLSLHIADNDLKGFYHELMKSEAGHYLTFVELAKEYMPVDVVEKRLEELLIAEAKIISSLELRGDRIH